MTLAELAEKVAADINRQSSLVTASVDGKGNLVLTSKTTGTGTGLNRAQISAPDETLTNTAFEGGRDIVAVNLVGNRGDTYFQRWDSMKTYPQSSEDLNQVIDIASVMLETHINLDGRSDLDRGVSKLASIDWTNFGKINKVYSQPDNFIVGTDTDESLNLDSYRSSLTWTLPKAANAEIDEWTHVTLASSLALDGDKGPIQALRRFQNSILAFQDKGIAEVLFNSRTQLATEQGVPVEIANTGKVDGKRYISSKYGTINKWSVMEGKLGLYFIDNINKILGRFDGNGVESLSTKHGFDAWLRDNHSLKAWNPQDNGNFVTFYDKLHSDVYFLKNNDNEQPCLVYNEVLDTFSSFYDYAGVPMMTNIGDRFLSYYQNGLWLQNEGLYNSFFGEYKPFWITWRVSPNQFTDKIWTNIDFRADFLKVLEEDGGDIIGENGLIDGDVLSYYDPNETFDTLTVWNEYQTTGEKPIANTTGSLAEYPDIRKRFRTWRLTIPRATVTNSNKFGLDRIRNPWVFVKLMKNTINFGTELMQLHDVVVKYFEENT